MAHARRKFFDLNSAQPSAIAQEALERIAVLYETEQRGETMTLGQRSALRQSEAAPFLAALQDRLKTTRLTTANGGGAVRVIGYCLKR